MPKTKTQDETTETTAARRPIRRYNLDRQQREFLANIVLPQFIQKMTDNAAAMNKVAQQGGLDGLLTADAATAIAWQSMHNADVAQGIFNTVMPQDDDADDTSDNAELEL